MIYPEILGLFVIKYPATLRTVHTVYHRFRYGSLRMKEEDAVECTEIIMEYVSRGYHPPLVTKIVMEARSFLENLKVWNEINER